MPFTTREVTEAKLSALLCLYAHLRPKAVLKHALMAAWEHNCYKAMLTTSSADEVTLRLYERAGFQRGVKTGFVARSNN